ncbi:hypothetical protein M1M07_22900 [Rhodococcus sp. HM1]|uniref:hypothetical protein n=1 Tax=Rhodococcus sp. HM1 TaxID=2937759 RepID=UPI00200A347C|nr:hypothetical protein [Rhodococcus sp. HM1]MCK8673944.1 hypothetical protein [Rhodococcus sp. HM1]
MRNIRVAWSFPALAVGGFSVIALYVASWPQSAFTSCEVDPGYDPVTCTESLIHRRGAGYVTAMVLPALLCTVPALVPKRSTARATAGRSSSQHSWPPSWSATSR